MTDPVDPGTTVEPQAPRQADPKLLEMLVCPLTRTTLIYDRERQELISRAGKVAYPIRDGVPILYVDEARLLDPGPALRTEG